MHKDQFTNDILNIINEGWEGRRIDSHGRSWPSNCVDIGTIGRDIDSYCRRIKRDEALQKEAEPKPHTQIWNTEKEGRIEIEVGRILAEQRRKAGE